MKSSIRPIAPGEFRVVGDVIYFRREDGKIAVEDINEVIILLLAFCFIRCDKTNNKLLVKQEVVKV